MREITNRFPCSINANFVDEQFLNNKSVLNILHPSNDPCELVILCGILSSRLLSLFYKQRAVKSARLLFPKIVVRKLREFPYPRSMSESLRTTLWEAVAELVRVTKDVRLAETPQPLRHNSRRRLELLERRINDLVYKAFNLTIEEVALVEAADA